MCFIASSLIISLTHISRRGCYKVSHEYSKNGRFESTTPQEEGRGRRRWRSMRPLNRMGRVFSAIWLLVARHEHVYFVLKVKKAMGPNSSRSREINRCGRTLARFGHKVTLFEREEVGAFSQASSINSGFLHTEPTSDPTGVEDWNSFSSRDQDPPNSDIGHILNEVSPLVCGHWIFLIWDSFSQPVDGCVQVPRH